MRLRSTQHGVCRSPTGGPLQTVPAHRAETQHASQCRQHSPARSFGSTCKPALHRSTSAAKHRRPWLASEARCDTISFRTVRWSPQISGGTGVPQLVSRAVSASGAQGADGSQPDGSAASLSGDGAHGGPRGKKRLAVFVSGGGSNMRAIYAATLDGRLPAGIEVPVHSLVAGRRLALVQTS